MMTDEQRDVIMNLMVMLLVLALAIMIAALLG
jgi:hypothetical protein